MQRNLITESISVNLIWIRFSKFSLLKQINKCFAQITPDQYKICELTL